MTSKYKVFYHYYENCFATFVLLRKEQTHIDFTSKASIPDDFATAIKEEFLITIIQARESSLNSQFPPYLSKAQAAKYLGISTQTLTEWMLNPNLHLPYKKICKTYRFSRLELDRFMTSTGGDH